MYVCIYVYMYSYICINWASQMQSMNKQIAAQVKMQASTVLTETHRPEEKVGPKTHKRTPAPTSHPRGVLYICTQVGSQTHSARPQPAFAKCTAQADLESLKRKQPCKPTSSSLTSCCSRHAVFPSRLL